MKNFITLSIADYNVQFAIPKQELFNVIIDKYSVYISTSKPDFFIDVEIVRKENYRLEDVSVMNNSDFYFFAIAPGSEIELNLNLKKGTVKLLNITKIFDIALRIIYSRLLTDYNGFLVHSAAIKKEDKGYLFYGPSDAGKTTISKISDKFGLDILSDELSAVRKIHGEYFLYATPFWGEFNGTYRSDRVKLESLIKPIKSNKLKLHRIHETEFISSFLGTLLNFCNDSFINNIYLNNVSDLGNQVKGYNLEFKKDDNIWEAIN